MALSEARYSACWWLLHAAGLMLAAIVLTPVGVVLWRALADSGGAWQALVEYRLARHLWQTLALVAVVVTVTLLVGVPCAWLIARYEFTGRGFLRWALLLPIAMPGFVAASSYVSMLHQLSPFYLWVRKQWGIEAFLMVQEWMPWLSAVTVLSFTLYPYVYLSARAVFERQGALAIDAARVLGEKNWGAFWRVGLPLARPGCVAGASLVMMEVMNDYGVVSAFGLSPLTSGIFRAWGEGKLEVAMRLALILLCFVSIVLVLERWQRGRRRFVASDSGGPDWHFRQQLCRRDAALALACCTLPLVPGFIIPVWRLGTWVFQSQGLTEWQGHLRASCHSFGLALAAVMMVLTGCLVMVAAQRAFASRTLLITQKVGLAGYGFPSALVAVGVAAGLTWLSQRAEWLGWLALSASLCGLLLGYMIRFFAVGIQPLVAGFYKVPPSLAEQARTLGESPLGAMWRAEVPLIWPAVAAASILVFLDVFKELTLTLVLRPFNFETLATRVYRLTDEGRMVEAAVPGLLLVVMGTLGLLLLSRLLEGRRVL